MDNNIFNHNSDWNNNADNQNVSNQTNIYAGTTDYTGQSGNMEINMTDAMYNNDQYYQNNNLN